MRAELVFDGLNYNKPICMGEPKDDQLQGTVREQVTELCGRICYDSLGKGRSSESYHKHIAEVGHLSVQEHTPITVELIPVDIGEVGQIYRALANRPGVFIIEQGNHIRITANFRAINEWFLHGNRSRVSEGASEFVRGTLNLYGNMVAPQIVTKVPTTVDLHDSVLSEPFYDEEKWITLYMSGSRGFSHEQVRHGDYTAISQRSTRYVDESSSPWFDHPALQAYFDDTGDNDLGESCGQTKETCAWMYDQIVEKLQPWLQKRGVDKLSARKQARGAARGFLGNALKTEMMFSASISQWHRMLAQRASGFADAEIREIYARETGSVIHALQCSQYSDNFQDYKIVETKDGIGVALERT